jgi:hypothetical protein
MHHRDRLASARDWCEPAGSPSSVRRRIFGRPFADEDDVREEHGSIPTIKLPAGERHPDNPIATLFDCSVCDVRAAELQSRARVNARSVRDVRPDR